MPKVKGYKTQTQHNDFTFILKLNKQDREMLDDIQLSKVNASELFRQYIRDEHKKLNKKRD